MKTFLWKYLLTFKRLLHTVVIYIHMYAVVIADAEWDNGLEKSISLLFEVDNYAAPLSAASLTL